MKGEIAMMADVAAWLVGGVLFLVSGIHWYWMAGGKMGGSAAIPARGSELLFRPTRIATGIVAAAMALAGWFVLELGEVVEQLLFAGWFYTYGGWALAGIFLIRSIGEFRWVGFFKRERGTLFAKWDTVLYSPLCLCIGVLLIWMTMNPAS
jgi:hypothetical protein